MEFQFALLYGVIIECERLQDKHVRFFKSKSMFYDWLC